MSRLENLDSARAVAAIGIIAYHCRLHDLFAWWWGVMDFFFVMSGMLITRTMLILLKKEQGMGTFIIYRAARLFPVFLLVAAVFELIALYTDNGSSSYTLPYLLLYQNLDLLLWSEEVFPRIPAFTHTWSLILEEQFYLVTGALFFSGALAFKRLSYSQLVIIAGMLVVAAAARYNGAHWWTIAGRFDGFMVGTFLGFLIFSDMEKPAHIAKSPTLLLAWKALVAICFTKLLYGAALSYIDLEAYKNSAIWLDVSCYVICSVAFILWLMKMEGSWVNRLFSLFRLPAIGLFSYELYVVHVPISSVLNKLIDFNFRLGSTTQFFMVLVLSLACGYLLHVTLTKPALANRHKLRTLLHFGGAKTKA